MAELLPVTDTELAELVRRHRPVQYHGSQVCPVCTLDDDWPCLPARLGADVQRARAARGHCATCGANMPGVTRRRYCANKCRQKAYGDRQRQAPPEAPDAP